MSSPPSATLLREPLLRSAPQRLGVPTSSSHPPPSHPPLSHPPERKSAEKPARSALASLLHLPKQLLVVLLIDFLNSYRSFGFRSVQYQYLVNEFGIGDLEAGSLLGLQAWLLVVFGMIGAMLVDAWGVRKTAVIALSVAAASRAVLAFGQTKLSLQVALLGLSPFGEAVLSTGIYTVALKKLTTHETRRLAFGVQYSVSNLAGAFSDLAADFFRRQDFTVPAWVPDWLWEGDTFSGLRAHVLGTLVAVLAALLVSVFCLFDSVLVPLDEPAAQLFTGHASPPPLTFDEITRLRDNATAAQRARGYLVTPVSPSRPKPRRPMAPSPIFGRLNLERLKNASSPAAWVEAALAATRRAVQSIRSLLELRNFWVALWFSACLFFISKQWGDMDQLLPPYLERHHGLNTPIYAIHSINMWVCMLAPSLIAVCTAHLNDFSVILPGLWVMALSPLWLSCEPGVPAAIGWVFFSSLGEVIWSPRQSAWIASIAPDGREGVFLALLSLKSLVTTIPSTTLNGYLNAVFNPNCPTCRDDVGHFCDEQIKLNATAYACRAGGYITCVGLKYSPELISSDPASLQCPSTCVQCPGWQDGAQTMWLTVFLFSVASPIMVQLSLPYLKSVDGKGQQA
ncbi:hypothetical protein AB1Y20_012711 [Prymnesium parvum]|uniref:Major facilitator superfamily (MFS) profile domain-containing protein n=1 Tax=Prymnesium parvum TaxID=97485 RepID=A0AB34IIN4_PRYPA